MKLMYDIRSETGLYHDRLPATSEREALGRFAGEEGHIVQCGNQRPYLVIDDFSFYAQPVVEQGESRQAPDG